MAAAAQDECDRRMPRLSTAAGPRRNFARATARKVPSCHIQLPCNEAGRHAWDAHVAHSIAIDRYALTGTTITPTGPRHSCRRRFPLNGLQPADERDCQPAERGRFESPADAQPCGPRVIYKVHPYR
jgi:hypothetical protein